MTKNPFNDIAEEYDAWFEEHSVLYRSELEALKTFIPREGKGLDIGTGTGRFADELGITTGIEPAPNMADLARKKGIQVQIARAEELPFADESFDFAMMVTIDCFLDNLEAACREAHRVLKPGGRLVIGMLDKNGAIARHYRNTKESGIIYSRATFHTPDQTAAHLRKAGFSDIEFRQTLFSPEPEQVEQPKPGYGEGSFVVIKASKHNE
ncbi:class I SAM-dependent methyltransferase [Halalkalibaculum sp. DA384]|uniref:class I SAM-dependent methyltransferase n=1 Tax=Halalkalibaculum sp. DA384 TaxID=3373606 RepID=UPI0037553CED